MLTLGRKLFSEISGNRVDIFGEQDLTMHVLPYYLLPFVIFIGSFLLIDYPWFIIVIVYTLLPLMDEIFSLDTKNPSK